MRFTVSFESTIATDSDSDFRALSEAIGYKLPSIEDLPINMSSFRMLDLFCPKNEFQDHLSDVSLYVPDCSTTPQSLCMKLIRLSDP